MIIERGDCTFVDKARKAQAAGAAAVIVTDNVPESGDDQPMFAMSGDGKDDVIIPVVFLFSKEAELLSKYLEQNSNIEVSVYYVCRFTIKQYIRPFYVLLLLELEFMVFR